MGTIGKIKFERNCNMSFVNKIISAILTDAQGDFSKVVLSFYFRELPLIDKIFAETDVEYIEGATWEESTDIEEFLDNHHLENLLSLNIYTDKFDISANFQETTFHPVECYVEKHEVVHIHIQRKMARQYSTQEENNAKIELEALCRQVFNDVTTLHFCTSHGESADLVMASLELPFEVAKNLPCLLKSISPTCFRAAYLISINRYNKNNFPHDFIHKFDMKPKGIYAEGRHGHFNMPFSVNSQGILYPICNCSRDSAFKFAEFVQSNVYLFKNFRLFFPGIAWSCDNGISCYDPSNQAMLRLSDKGMELTIDYEQYKDSDPPLKKVREFINGNLSEFGISFQNAKPIIV
jgi:hypothetical protein